jgi:hypothetical protein
MAHAGADDALRRIDQLTVHCNATRKSCVMLLMVALGDALAGHGSSV